MLVFETTKIKNINYSSTNNVLVKEKLTDLNTLKQDKFSINYLTKEQLMNVSQVLKNIIRDESPKNSTIKNQNLDSFSHAQNIWFHCSSLGEFEMAKPLIDLFLKDGASQVLVSFFSPSGYENCPEANGLKKF